MTKPLTPEEARDAALFAEAFIEGDIGSYSHHAWTGVIQKLIPFARSYADQAEELFARRVAVDVAYTVLADQLERLEEIETAVREMLPHYEGMETGDGEPCPQMARLRSLMEKTSEAHHETD